MCVCWCVCVCARVLLKCMQTVLISDLIHAIGEKKCVVMATAVGLPQVGDASCQGLVVFPLLVKCLRNVREPLVQL